MKYRTIVADPPQPPTRRACPEIGGAGVGHHAYTVPFGLLYRAACSCGWRGDYANRKRENAVRVARRHVQEAQA